MSSRSNVVFGMVSCVVRVAVFWLRGDTLVGGRSAALVIFGRVELVAGSAW
jgi:hypothetical protein